MRIRVIKLWPETGAFRVRLLFNTANRFDTEPREVAGEMTAAIGPMADFVDNWPQQLIHEPEDKDAFVEEARLTLAWHRRAAGFILERYSPDVFIQDTYTPNQMLESPWWMPDIDRGRPGYDARRAETAMRDVLEMYAGIDAVIGEAMAKAGGNAIIALSSDHGICPLRRQVLLNNLFHQKGWLSWTADPDTGELTIDWQRTRVVYLKMAHVYVGPGGLAGDWKRGSGPEYDALRAEVAAALAALRDDDGTAPLKRVVRWEEAQRELGLPADRVGDLVLEVLPGYQTWEEITASGDLFQKPATGGYKQGMDPKTTPAVWTPFVIMGPGVRPGSRLEVPISHVDQMPTLLRLLGIEVPAHVEGRVLGEILDTGSGGG